MSKKLITVLKFVDYDIEIPIKSCRLESTRRDDLIEYWNVEVQLTNNSPYLGFFKYWYYKNLVNKGSRVSYCHDLQVINSEFISTLVNCYPISIGECTIELVCDYIK